MKKKNRKKMKNKFNYKLLKNILLAILLNILFTQNNFNFNQLFETGKKLEELGKNEEAVEIYIELFNKFKSNKQYFKKLKEIFLKNESYEELIIIYTEHINSFEKSKDRFLLEIELLEIKIWNQTKDWELYLNDIVYSYIINSKQNNYTIKKNHTKYIVQKLIKNNKEKQAYELIKSIRKYFKEQLKNNDLKNNNLSSKDTIFLSRDMISVFSKKKQYEKAIEESILFLKGNSKNHFYNIIKEQVFIFIDKIIEQATTYDFDLPISNKQFNANTFLNYQTSREYKQDKINYVIEICNHLIENNIEKNQAKLKLADIQYNIFNDLDNAYKIYAELENKKLNKQINYIASIKKIDILINKGYLDSAALLIENKIQEFQKIDFLNNKNTILNDLIYKDIQILFYKGNYSKMNQKLNLLIDKNELQNKYLNDLLEIKTISLFFNKEEKEFQQYALVQHKIKMNKMFEANLELIQLINSDNILISELAQFQYALLEIKKGNIEEAQQIISEMNQKTIFSELSLIINAEIEDYIYKNYEISINLYEEFLIKYPNSIYKENIIKRLNQINVLRDQKIDS